MGCNFINLVLKQFAIASGLMLFWLAALPYAYAEATRLDQNIVRLMRDDPTLGVVFMEARLSEQGETRQKHCQSIRMKLLSDAGVTTAVVTQVSRMHFGKL